MPAELRAERIDSLLKEGRARANSQLCLRCDAVLIDELCDLISQFRRVFEYQTHLDLVNELLRVEEQLKRKEK